MIVPIGTTAFDTTENEIPIHKTVNIQTRGVDTYTRTIHTIAIPNEAIIAHPIMGLISTSGIEL